MEADKKRQAIFKAASDVFALYGFRRTSMQDIADAAGISRPALYLMFDNKEDLFRHLASHRQMQAIDEAISLLSSDGTLEDRFVTAIRTYEKIFYESVAEMPHGAELADVNMSIAADQMKKNRRQLVSALTKAIEDAIKRGDAKMPDASMKPRAFVELLFSSINGQKLNAKTMKEFRQSSNQVIEVFIRSIKAR